MFSEDFFGYIYVWIDFCDFYNFVSMLDFCSVFNCTCGGFYHFSFPHFLSMRKGEELCLVSPVS